MTTAVELMKRVLFVLACLAVPGIADAAKRPNIVWITAEDMSPTLGCYGDAYATTPYLDRFAQQSVRYTHAFATAPVCSPSRNCLITGCYPTALGTHNMRSAFPLPDTIHGFPSFLREAGYFTTNNVKTDYNTAAAERLTEESWDLSSPTAHWRDRPDASQPFFSVFNLMVSHQSRSMVWPTEKFAAEVQSRLQPSQIHDPQQAVLPPYYPDTRVVRREVARFYDCVTVMDQQVGELLQQLHDDGLAEHTIVFFYSDHGSGMPRHKRVLLDSGMRVPLIIRFPDAFKSLAPAAPGESIDRLVSFVDFPPTVLNLAGIDAPEYMQGFPFLGDDATTQRVSVHGHRDRIDEVFDMARSVRGKRYLYIRNFMPHLGYNQPSAWPDAGEINSEFLGLSDEELARPGVQQFVSGQRPVEEFYDCDKDPHNLENLARFAGDHQQILQQMRTELVTQMANAGDRGVVPEAILFQNQDRYLASSSRLPFGSDVRAELNAAIRSSIASAATLQNLLSDTNPAVRYWGAISCCRDTPLEARNVSRLEALLRDRSATVRIAAADALARHGEVALVLPVLAEALQHEDLNVVLHGMRTIELMGAAAATLRGDVEELYTRIQEATEAIAAVEVAEPGRADLLMFVDFSASAFLAATADEDN
jgi:N-sulfoglucosamine sulfohydrolase